MPPSMCQRSNAAVNKVSTLENTAALKAGLKSMKKRKGILCSSACKVEPDFPESFGFADELRRQTAEEELEEFGDGSSVLPNTARKLINAVRRKKGLPVEEKVVQHATKQRTVARKV
ncbi:hypothetical protein TB2_035474 [Malus domestica]